MELKIDNIYENVTREEFVEIAKRYMEIPFWVKNENTMTDGYYKWNSMLQSLEKGKMDFRKMSWKVIDFEEFVDDKGLISFSIAKDCLLPSFYGLEYDIDVIPGEYSEKTTVRVKPKNRSNNNKKISLFDLNLPVMTENALYKNGIQTMEQLEKCTETQLKSFKNLGNKGVQEIRQKLNLLGKDLVDEMDRITENSVEELGNDTIVKYKGYSGKAECQIIKDEYELEKFMNENRENKSILKIFKIKEVSDVTELYIK